jgi:hypothetical protein
MTMKSECLSGSSLVCVLPVLHRLAALLRSGVGFGLVFVQQHTARISDSFC